LAFELVSIVKKMGSKWGQALVINGVRLWLLGFEKKGAEKVPEKVPDLGTSGSLSNKSGFSNLKRFACSYRAGV